MPSCDHRYILQCDFKALIIVRLNIFHVAVYRRVSSEALRSVQIAVDLHK